MKHPNALPFGLDEKEINKQLEKRLDDLAEKTEFYLRKKVSLNEIADLLATNRTYASRMINITKGCKFNAYINDLRLAKAEKLFGDATYMATHKIRELAADCGFASVSTFRRAFTQKYKKTPLSYINSNGFKNA